MASFSEDGMMSQTAIKGRRHLFLVALFLVQLLLSKPQRKGSILAGGNR